VLKGALYGERVLFVKVEVVRAAARKARYQWLKEVKETRRRVRELTNGEGSIDVMRVVRDDDVGSRLIIDQPTHCFAS
jgi:hypothetical protein